MKRKYLICLTALLLAIAGTVFLAGCGQTKKYKITVKAEDYMVRNCPDSAREGETVTLEIADVTDAYVYVWVNGDKDYGHYNKEGLYEFIMPAEDVTIEVDVVGNGLARTPAGKPA